LLATVRYRTERELQYTYTGTSQSVIPFVFRQTADRLKGSICDVSFIEKKL